MIRLILLAIVILGFTGCKSHEPAARHDRTSRMVNVDVSSRSVDVTVRPPGARNVDVHVAWP